MLWLADENIPAQAIALLRQLGEDVFAIAEERRGITDQSVIEIAREQGRILISFDRDHGELIFNRAINAPRAVVLVRIFPPDPDQLHPLLSWLVELGQVRLDGYFTVLSDSGIRQRPLPVAR